ncbi:hypothetical protein HHL16_16025 [Pseudoflavitalea sp. G-6-1-2]|uniref:hypothetical protein n=1 Tax=Pseudoflavitalea sp. G-6-1-2 TaxID=2728841 RepID=UPI00146CA369|nr:hypothetical protein [Pseudoflavitalea sp. G-6-1-2]NML22392.1 hypothetical protein [Pseudoflavitalea sp. G-6-1-2]
MQIIHHHFMNAGRMAMVCLLLTVITAGCSKSTLNEDNPATLVLFNALENGVSVRANLSGKHPITYLTALEIRPRNRALIYSKQANQPASFFSVPDTLPASIPVWSGDLKLEKGKTYSMFLVNGNKGAENVLMEENIPAPGKDSLTYLRFANMSSAQPVSINIKGNPLGSLVSQLNFKETSAMLQLPADRSVASYIFEVHDATTGNLLAAYTANNINVYTQSNPYLFKTWSLVFTGKPGATGANLQQLTVLRYF